MINNLNLTLIGEENMTIKTFGCTSGNAIKASQYSFCLKGVGGMNLYVKGYEVPMRCTAVHGQLINVAKDKFPFLKDLTLKTPKGAKWRPMTYV